MNTDWDFIGATIWAALTTALLVGVAYFAPAEWRLLATISSVAVVVVFAVVLTGSIAEGYQQQQIALQQQQVDLIRGLSESSKRVVDLLSQVHHELAYQNEDKREA